MASIETGTDLFFADHNYPARFQRVILFRQGLAVGSGSLACGLGVQDELRHRPYQIKGAQLESLLEMLPGLPKLDDISEPVLDEAERVLKKWGEDSPSWLNAVRPFLSAPPAAATNVVAVACQSVVVGLFLGLNE